MYIYRGIFSEAGNIVEEDNALDYAMKRCGITKAEGAALDSEFSKMFVEWFYSGDWLYEVDPFVTAALRDSGLQLDPEGEPDEDMIRLITDTWNAKRRAG